MTTFIRFSIVLSLLMLGLSSAVSAQDTAAITLERTACRGTCPIYTVSIFEDGTVSYNGTDFVGITGEQSSSIEPETVAQMVEAFADAGYFDWDESYENQTVSDLPTIITSVTRDGETHRIARYVGDFTAPLALPYLEQWIDEMTNTALWTGVQPDPAAISNGTDTAIITLQRTECFGDCPVYNIAIFADGTVVYTGIANVDEIGVHLSTTDATGGILAQAQAIGYFDWLDSYEERTMTDQATVITSIRTEDQTKRIVRYNGDPNAPVGLLWVEDSIDRLVTEQIG